MKVFAAIDLRAGAAVQLVGGDPAAERVRLPDPAAVARHWLARGFRHLHVVDLDAALGEGSNEDALREIGACGTGAPAPAVLQVGGGIRDGAAIDRTLGLGADRVIVGTRAIEDRVWLERAAAARPGRLVVAADVKDGVVLTRGWREETALVAEELLAGLAPIPLAAVLVTDVTREGRQEGVDAALFARLVAASPHPLLAAGGITDRDDLRSIRDAGADGAVLGMALYTGRIAAADALEMEDV